MLDIENNRENHPILNQICDILTELYNQGNSPWKDSRRKHNIQSDIRTLLRKSCEVEKMMKFLRETEVFEKIFLKNEE